MPLPPEPKNRRFTLAQGMLECGENGVVRSAARDNLLTRGGTPDKSGGARRLESILKRCWILLSRILKICRKKSSEMFRGCHAPLSRGTDRISEKNRFSRHLQTTLLNVMSFPMKKLSNWTVYNFCEATMHLSSSNKTTFIRGSKNE
jgi:hypothetical protein